MIDSLRISRIDMLMKIAETVSERGTCSRARVGALVARDGRILTIGYNGAPAGLPHCNHDDDPPDYAGCRVSVHAEANCISYAAKHGIRLFGAELYTTFSPCLACAQLIINAGICTVYIRNEYRIKDGEDLLQAAHVDIMRV